MNWQEVVCNFWCQQLPPTHPDTCFHIHICTKKKTEGKKHSTPEAFHTCRGWKGRGMQQKHLEVYFCVTFFFFTDCFHYFLCDNSSVTVVATNAGWFLLLSIGIQRSRRQSNIHRASYLYFHIHSALVWIINATREVVRKRISMREERLGDRKEENRWNKM